jgi:hypothetical protein
MRMNGNTFYHYIYTVLNLSFACSISFSLTACLPEDIPNIDTDAPSISYQDFEGITSAETVSESRLRVSWTASTDSRVVAYNIYDSTFKFNPQLIRTVSAPQTEVTLNGLAPHQLYSFRVKAADAENVEDDNMNDLPAIPYGGALSAQVISSTSARIHFTQAADVDAIALFCRADSGEFERYATVLNLNQTSVNISDLTPGTVYTCRVAVEIDGFIDNNPNTVQFTPMGQAYRLAFSNQPGNSSAGAPLSQQPAITILDENDNIVAGGPDSSALISLTISGNSPSSGVINGTVQVPAENGVALFSGLNINEAGLKIIQATKADTSSEPFGTAQMTLDSESFMIVPGPASAEQSTITTLPASPPAEPLIANGTNTYDVTITLRDSFGNPISGVRPTIATNVPGDTIIQPNQDTNAAGQAMAYLSATVADAPPSLIRTARISAPGGLSSVTATAPFRHGPASRVVFTTQPLNTPAGEGNMAPVRVAVQDAQGNLVNSGDQASASISLSIASNVNGAILYGTYPINANLGIADFVDLGIDQTGVAYRLIASSGSLSPAFSNNFNITAGIPQVIAVSGPSSTLSGRCSQVVTVQLQDNGGNPANAIQNTPVNVSGLQNTSMFTSSNCSGSPISSITFTAGTHTRSVYLRNNSAQGVNINFTDTSGVMASAQLETHFSPNKMTLLAQAPPPAPPMTPLSVMAGTCSQAILITPMGNNDQPGPTFIPTQVSVTGLTGTGAEIFSDSSCSQLIDPAQLTLPINSGPNYAYQFFLRHNLVEDLTISVSDPASQIETVSTPQTVRITPSAIGFTGPSDVVAGACSTAFSVTLTDALGNPATALQNKTLNIQGIPAGSPARFYTSAACSGAGSNTSVTFPQGASALNIYFRSTSAALFDLSLTDPDGLMTPSPVIQLAVSPSTLRMTRPVAAQSNTNICAGPFHVETLDALDEVTNAVNPITVQLTGAGSAGYFYEDSSCAEQIHQITFSPGENTHSFYFKGYYPESNLTFVASDMADVLSSDSKEWTVNAAKAWLGTAASMYDEQGNLQWFRQNAKPVAARFDGIHNVDTLTFDPTYQYLYVLDRNNRRIIKYDYINQQYIGWIGSLNRVGGIGVSESNIPFPSSALCASTQHAQPLPGWCVGGQSGGNWASAARGDMHSPIHMADDGQYIYVANNVGSVNRYVSETGEFAGFIGWITNNSGMTAAPGGPASCATIGNSVTTPGWCQGGTAGHPYNNLTGMGDGRMSSTRAVAFDDNYLYVLTRHMVNRYDKFSGAFAGWIGRVETTPTGGEAGCTMTAGANITPGWCLGGSARRDTNPVGGINAASHLYLFNDLLYVVHSNGRIVSYDKDTGAVIQLLPNLTQNWHSTVQMTTDGNHFFFADHRRVIKVDTSGLLQSWIGKVSSNAGMSGPMGCATTPVNENTPGWCLGGMARLGFDDGSFREAHSIAYDGQGHLLVGQSNGASRIQRFSLATGEYLDTMSLEATSPTHWSNDANAISQRAGFDDDSMNNPSAIAVFGNHLFLAEYSASRVKKMNLRTGEVLGWVGNITTRPTGGLIPACNTTNPFTASPGWCRGSQYLPDNLFGNENVNLQANGILQSPLGVASDGTYVYVTDYNQHRITRYLVSTGEPQGWIGRVLVTPAGGAPGCSSTPAGNFTPGWCTGGRSQSGNGDGALSGATELVVVAGNIYVIDSNNHRVNSYNAATGQFNGWIGRVNVTDPPTGGCTVESNGIYNVSTSGWCLGGRSQQAGTNDRGGGFYFWSNRSGITSDGTYLYVANFYNGRIDKITLNGVFVAATRSDERIYVNSWRTDPDDFASWTWSCAGTMSLWTDGTHLYGTNHEPCNRDGSAFNVWKMNLNTGTMIGWQGGIRATDLPFGGDPGCAGATESTPGWCQGGGTTMGRRIGQFSGNTGFVTGDEHFIYVTDQDGNRVTRFPK